MTKDLTEREGEREKDGGGGGGLPIRASVCVCTSVYVWKKSSSCWLDRGGNCVQPQLQTRRHKHHPTTHSNLRVKKNTFVTRAKNGLRPAISERACFCRVYTVERKAPIKPCPSARMLCEHCCGRRLRVSSPATLKVVAMGK